MISPKLLFYYIKISLNIFRLIFIILPWLKQIIILCITDVHLCGKTCMGPSGQVSTPLSWKRDDLHGKKSYDPR